VIRPERDFNADTGVDVPNFEGGATMKTCFVISLFIVAALVSLSLADVASAGLDLLGNKSADPWTNLLPVSGRNSLLDPSRLQISHQLVFSYASGSMVTQNTAGLFLTSFQYAVSNPLTLNVTLGSALTHSQPRGFQANELFLQNFSLRYAPNDNFLLFFSYNGAPYNRLYIPTH